MSRFGMVLRRTGIGCVLGVWFSSSTVAADPIWFSPLRHIQGSVAAETEEGSFGIFTLDDGTDLTGLFNGGLTFGTPPEEWGPELARFSVTQHTDVAATRWFGSGTAHTEGTEGFPSGTADADSVMFIDFTLAEPMFYQFGGTISSAGGGSTEIIFEGPPGLGWVIGTSGGAIPLVSVRSGLLSPGEYSFLARAHSTSEGGFGRSAFNLQFTLSDPVPEPATLLLFATGAAAVGRTAWKRRKSDSDLKST